MHIRYDEDPFQQDLANRLASEEAVQSRFVSAPCATLNAVSVVKTDFDTGDQCYVLHVAATADLTSVAASLSNNTIKLYSAREAGGLSFVGTFDRHTDTITSISYPLADTPHALYSSSEDGSVRGWDVRSGQQVESFSAGHSKLWSLSLAGNYIAAGSNGQVIFWDRRNGKQCASFSDTHAEDVTQVLFHPIQQSKLLSASVDGLVAVFDIANGLDEDNGFMAALNLDNSVSSMGFYGQQQEKLWCLSHTETLHLWEWAAACDEESTGFFKHAAATMPSCCTTSGVCITPNVMEPYSIGPAILSIKPIRPSWVMCSLGGQGVLGEDTQARSSLAQAARTTVNAEDLRTLDYLITCTYSSSTGQLLLLAGNNDGAVGCFPVTDPVRPGMPCGLGSPQTVMSEAHDAVVRSAVWSESGTIITGGEDARLVQWTGHPEANAEQPMPLPRAGRTAGAVKRKDAAGARRRQSPY